MVKLYKQVWKINFGCYAQYIHLSCALFAHFKQSRCHCIIFFSVQKEHVGHHSECRIETDKLELLNALKRRASHEERSLKHIFDEETRHSPAAHALSFSEVESTMYRERKKSQPSVPDDLRQLPGVLERNLLLYTEDGSSFFRDMVDCGGNGVAFLFATNDQLEMMGGRDTIMMDGTFKTVPRQFNQMYTIFCQFSGHALPGVFILMTRKTEELYRAVFNKIRELNPLFSPQRVMSDYEAAPVNAIKSVFPEIESNGCWFHYVDRIRFRVQKYDLTQLYRDDDEVRKAVKKLMCLPLLPAGEIGAAFAHIKASMSPRLRILLSRLLRYVFRYWIRQVGPQRMSVHGCRDRTNNAVEAFHSTLKRKLGIHPSLFSHLPRLKKIGEDTSNEVGRLRGGHDIRRRQRKSYVLNNKRIRDCTRRFDSGQCFNLELAVVLVFVHQCTELWSIEIYFLAGM